MAFDSHSTTSRAHDELPEKLSAEAVNTALNCLTGAMKGKQLGRALDALDRAIMARAPRALSPVAPNVVGIRSKLHAAYYAGARQVLEREALELSAVASIVRGMVTAREVAAARRARK